MKSWCGSSRTDARKRSVPWADALLVFALLLASVAGAASVPAGGVLARPVPSRSEALDEARRLLREGSEDPELLRRVAAGGGLFPIRARLLSAALALGRSDGPGVEAALAGLPQAPLGIDGLPAFLRAAASGSARNLVGFARSAGDGILPRAALLQASRLARGEAERTAVRAAIERLGVAPVRSPRAVIARTLALSHVSGKDDARRLLVELLAVYPDPVVRAADLFEPADGTALNSAARSAPGTVRLERARALVGRDADEALALAGSLPKSPENRLALAELALAAGRAREASRALDRPDPLVFTDPPRALHARVLRLLALLRDERRATARRHRGRPLPLRGSAVPRPGGHPVTPAEEEELASLLAAPLGDADRKALLVSGLRHMVALRDADGASRLVGGILLLDPASTAGAEDLFLQAFVLYRRGLGKRSTPDLLEAGRLWEEQGTRFREVSVRRRAVYWAGRARLAAGERRQAHALWAGLVSGTSADVYARWAAASLGFPFTPPPLPPDLASPGLPEETPATASRELLACGMPGLAEDAAETEGSLDADFAVLLASERGDHRRAAALLKARYPALGTPEEGGVPLAARRAFYPLGASRALLAAAEESRVSPALLFGLVRQESLFAPAVRSHAGAVGLLQVMPATGRFVARLGGQRGKPDLTDPATNARLGAAYLSRLFSSFAGDAAAALAAYNAGPGRVARWRREAAGLASDEFLEAIPLREPREYVKRVLFFEGAYAALYGIPSDPITRPDAVSPAPPR